jgi:hypothetical protein
LDGEHTLPQTQVKQKTAFSSAACRRFVPLRMEPPGVIGQLTADYPDLPKQPVENILFFRLILLPILALAEPVFFRSQTLRRSAKYNELRGNS